MRDMAHSICLIKLYQITMRKKFRLFVSDYLKLVLHDTIFLACVAMVLQDKLQVAACTTTSFATCLATFLGLQELHKVELGSTFCNDRRDFLRPGLHDIGLLFMPDRFPESGTKTLRSISVYTKPGKHPSDTISC